MHHFTNNRKLLHGWLTGAVILTGMSACSRSDRTETGSAQNGQTGAVVTPTDSTAMAANQPGTTIDTARSTADTSMSQAAPEHAGKTTPPSHQAGPEDTAVAGYRAMGRDSASSADTISAGTTSTETAAGDTASTEMAGAAVQVAPDSAHTHGDTVAVGDSAHIGETGERLESTQASEQANADTLSGRNESDRVRPPEDSSETLGAVTTTDSVAEAGVNSDTAVAGSAEMARDTSTVLAQADTAAQLQDTTGQIAADTAGTIQAQVDTSTTEPQTQVATEAPADTLASETEPSRAPEDSSEVLGDVTTEKGADTEITADDAPAGAAGVRTAGNNTVTGEAAVAQISREGRRCGVVSADESDEARWDLASSPATMNPCGTGTMTLPRIQTEE